VPFMTMNTNPVVWGPEAGIFNPERWLVPGGIPAPSDLPSGWSGLTTFCDGPRNCIGWRLGGFFFTPFVSSFFSFRMGLSISLKLRRSFGYFLYAIISRSCCLVALY